MTSTVSPGQNGQHAMTQASVKPGTELADDPTNDPLNRIGLVRNGIERSLATLLQHRVTARDPKAGGFEFAEIPALVLRQWHEDLCVAASNVQACNAYPELIGALEGLLFKYAAEEFGMLTAEALLADLQWPDGVSHVDGRAEVARAALTKVRQS